MKRSFLTGAVLFALIFLATPQTATAQGCSGTSVSQSCTWTATLTIQATLTCSVLQNFNFGTASGGGIVVGNETNTGRVRCQTNPGSSINVSFTLPTVLQNGAFSVPITFGGESARLYACDGSCGPVTRFSPHTGFTGFQVSSAGVAIIALGENGPGTTSEEVIINTAGAAAGVYTGVIVVNVVLQ